MIGPSNGLASQLRFDKSSPLDMEPDLSLQPIQPSRQSWKRFGVLIVLALAVLWGWRSAQSAFTTRIRAARASVAPPRSGASHSKDLPVDTRRPSSPQKHSEAPTGGLIPTLREQIANSPVLQDGDAQDSLLDSLDQAGNLWERTQRQNRQALQQLQRQVRIGDSRQAPHIVLITFEQARTPDEPESPRNRLFANLAQRGVSFAEHYAGGSSPSSGWWSLMTGRPASRASAGEARFQLRESDVTIATTLWKAGYDTAFFGVWSGRVAPLRCGFEEWTGLEVDGNEVPLFPAKLATARNQMTVAANANGERNVSLWKLLDIEIASFLHSHATPSRPWFLQVRLPELPAGSSTDSAETVVERTLTALEQNALSAQTCVFVTTLAGAQTAPEHSERRLRTPFVMVGGHPENVGRVARNVTVAWDLLPTLLDIAGATKRPRELEGRSLVQKSSSRPWDKERLLYWHDNAPNGVQLVRRGEWFGVVEPGARQLQLYHLPSDPDLKKDVASAHPAVVQQLLAPAPTHKTPISSR